MRNSLPQGGRHHSCTATGDTARSAFLSPALKMIVCNTKWVSQPYLSTNSLSSPFLATSTDIRNLSTNSLSSPFLATSPDLRNLQNFAVLTQSDFFYSRNLTLFNNVKQNVYFIVRASMAPLAETLLSRKSAFFGNLKHPFPCSSTHLMSYQFVRVLSVTGRCDN
jgi:hypothetical protein